MKVFLIVSIILFSATLYSQEKWSLEDCINHAKNNNIDIRKQQFQNKIIDEDITIAKGNYFPDANFRATQGYSLGNSFNVSTGVGQLESRFNNFSLSSNLTIFNGFKNKLKSQQAYLNTEKGMAELDKIKLDLSLNISNSYLQVLFNKEILLLAEEQELISQQELNRLTKLFKSALKSKNELLEMKAAFQQDKKETILAENNLKNSLISLQEILDIKGIEDFDILEINDFDFTLGTRDITFISNKVLEVNPLLKSTKLTADISEKNIEIAKTALYPRLDFNYSYSSSFYHIQGREDVVFNQDTNQFEDNGFFVQLDNNRTHYLGFSATFPIFNRFKSRSEIEKSKIQLEIAIIELENQNKELKNKIKIAYNDILTSKEIFETSSLALEAQKEVFSISRKKYNNGYINNNEFLISKSKYIQAHSELIKAKYNYLFKIKVLEYYQED